MTALVLGATSKIALEIAHRYAEMGHTIVLAARNTADAERSASDIRIRHDAQCHVVQFDALDFASHPALIESVEKMAGPIEIGVVAFGDMGNEGPPFDNFEAGRRVIGINFTGAASLCELMATRMAARKRGLIIGLSSVAGDRGRQSNYIYGSAKGAFTLFLQGLRNRLFHEGVHVMCVRLGFVNTRMTYGMKTAIPIAEPDVVSRIVVRRGLSKANDIYVPGFWRFIMLMIRSIPEFLFKRLKL